MRSLAGSACADDAAHRRHRERSTQAWHVPCFAISTMQRTAALLSELVNPSP